MQETSLLVFLYKYEAKNAPIILPGKAKIEPVPKMFLNNEIDNACMTAYHGPKKDS